MIKRIRPIRLNDLGDDVRNVQQALRLLGYPVPRAEENAGLAGPGTKSRITGFRTRSGLEPRRGDLLVNESTAAAIEESLRAKGIAVEGLGQRRLMPVRLGQVGASVAILQNALSLLGFSIDPIEVDTARAGASTESAVDRCKHKLKLKVLSTKVLVNEVAAAVIEHALESRHLIDLLIQPGTRPDKKHLQNEGIVPVSGARNKATSRHKGSTRIQDGTSPLQNRQTTLISEHQLHESKGDMPGTHTVAQPSSEKGQDAVRAPSQANGDNKWIIQGTVSYLDKSPVDGAVVKVIRLRRRANPQLLGQAVADAQGKYSIGFAAKQYLPDGTSSIDLTISVSDSSQGDKNNIQIKELEHVENKRTLLIYDFLLEPPSSTKKFAKGSESERHQLSDNRQARSVKTGPSETNSSNATKTQPDIGETSSLSANIRSHRIETRNGEAISSQTGPGKADIRKSAPNASEKRLFRNEKTASPDRSTADYPPEARSDSASLTSSGPQEVQTGLSKASGERMPAASDEIDKTFSGVPKYSVEGTARWAGNLPANGITISAFDRDLRSEQLLGQCPTDPQGFYRITYSANQFKKAGIGSADLVVKALTSDGSPLAVSDIFFNAPPHAKIDLLISDDRGRAPALFERIGLALEPLLEGVGIADLEENQAHQDLTFLCGETSLDKAVLARFTLAHRLAKRGIMAEFWFALLGGTDFRYKDNRSIEEQEAGIVEHLPYLGASRVQKALNRRFDINEISEGLRDKIDAWVTDFTQLAATLSVMGKTTSSFLKLALEDAGIKGLKRQEKFAVLFNEHQALTPKLLASLQKDRSFSKGEVAELRTSYGLAELTQSEFSVVRLIKQRFDIHEPERIPDLARQSEADFVELVTMGQSSGEVRVPERANTLMGQLELSEAEVYGKTLGRRVREAFPTTAFAGDLERALSNGGPKGLRHGKALVGFLKGHGTFELLNTSIDEFFQNNLHHNFHELTKDDDFRQEVKAVQRVFKLVPTFETTDALLADGLHSAQQVYRIGESEFVRRYAKHAGFSADSVRIAWRRAAETHATILTMVGDLKALEPGTLPLVLKTGNDTLAKFPNWNNLFQTGDLCECEGCRSVLSPAAYLTDLLMFLKDRRATNTGLSAKDILLGRRPDLGFLELNCNNALTALPYIDVVCEVLERAVTGGKSGVELAGLLAIPPDMRDAKAAVTAALEKEQLPLGTLLSLSRIDSSSPELWVAHGDAATYLLKKTNRPAFLAQVLCNTKTSEAELRAYPQYVDANAYAKLSQSRYPLTLPFDLFVQETNAILQKVGLQRWDLMRTLKGKSGPNDPTDGEIAAEYFGIASGDRKAPLDERRLIVQVDATVAGQQAAWGEPNHAAWLSALANVKTFLLKTGLEYEELLELLDLKFINPAGSITIQHLDASCDTDKKIIQVLDRQALDRIHRFLRLWRKLNHWQMWELDLVIDRLGTNFNALDEGLLIKLFVFERLRVRLGSGTTVEELCGMFGDLNTRTIFGGAHQKRADALYQRLFLNRRLMQPLDPEFAVALVSVKDRPKTPIFEHRPNIVAALGVREMDLDTLQALRKPSDGTSYISGDLTLANLSFLWRHTWLAKALKLRIDEWTIFLKLMQQDVLNLIDPQSALRLVEQADQLRATGFTLDELDWLLTANPQAKAAVKEVDAARALGTLRKDIKRIQSEYDSSQYSFLTTMTPSDVDRLTVLLTTLLQKLNRDDAEVQFFIATLQNEVSQAKKITSLPPATTFSDFPAPIKNLVPIRYDQRAQTLRFTGLMTVTQRTVLLTDPSLSALTSITDYRQAIEEFFTAPRLALKFFDPTFTAPLAALPAEVDFKALADTALVRRVFYDAERRLLSVAGILSTDDKAALNALSADPPYRDAINHIFADPLLGTFPAEKIWLEEADLLMPLRDPAVPANDHLAENLAKAVSKALAYLSKTLAEGTVVQQVSAQLGLTEAMTRRLLTQYPMLPENLLTHLTGTFTATSGVVDANTLTTTFDGWYWARRVATLLTKWKITLSEWERLSALTASAQLLDFATLPLNATKTAPSLSLLIRTSRLLKMRDALPEANISLLEVLEKLDTKKYAAAGDFASDVQRLNNAWLAADVEAIVKLLDSAYPADYLLAETWERLRRVFYFIESLNAHAATVAEFASTTMTERHAKRLKELLRSKLGTETWFAVSTEIQDVLRERKRNALADYLLTQSPPADAPTGKWQNYNDLYAYFLLDIEMASCQLTSRLVQASGSVQLFVQRCFMGLEQDVTVEADGNNGDSAWRWWTWMRKYRVWEANRKVFLWPENWIEPELKKDRSQFFKELEGELLQNEIDQYSVETAFGNYLLKLQTVAQLEVAGFYQEDDGDNTIVHAFGRTSGETHEYYYRRYDYREWTPWEKIDLEIHGDYLIPAVLNKRLFLFWPVFTEASSTKDNSKTPVPQATSPDADPNKPNDADVQPPQKKLRLQMAVSEWRQGKWTSKRVSKAYQESELYRTEITRRHYVFLAVDSKEIDGRFSIQYTGHSVDTSGTQCAELKGAFEMFGCDGLPHLVDTPRIPIIGSYGSLEGSVAVRPKESSTGPDPAFMKWAEGYSRVDNENDFALDYYLLNDPDKVFQPVSVPVLEQSPGFFRMTPSWFLSYLDKLLFNGWMRPVSHGHMGTNIKMGAWSPFFYNDQKRTFFVLPSATSVYGRNSDGDPAGRIHYPEVKRLYYPEIKRNVRQMRDEIEAFLEKIVADAVIPPPESIARQQIESVLAQHFPEEEMLPPYSDEKFGTLIIRFRMRVIDRWLGQVALGLVRFRQLHFKNFYHPLACSFAELIFDPLRGVPALMSRRTQLLNTGFSFESVYQPVDSVVASEAAELHPKEWVDFSSDGAYSPYNWEIFFFAPLFIANSLSRNQKHEEARKWYHFIFNPLGVESPMLGGSAMSKYWITKPFFETTNNQYVQQRIENILQMLAGSTSVPDSSEEMKKDLQEQVRDWRTNPFEPHRIANYRKVAYQKTVVMKYLDNLIAWGDFLFRQDSMESINEATQLYVLAAEILGPRPKKISAAGQPLVETFNELEHTLDNNFSNALVELENLVPLLPGNRWKGADQAPLPMLYFCIPQNDKMLAYWDTVADRLYKIRHCMNIEGVVRQLALFEPPIDPGALVKAVAGGTDLNAALTDLSAPLPLYRFNVLLQKANEVCNDLKSLGAALLAALEKNDAEALNLLRQAHEIRLLECVRAVRQFQFDEAKENYTALEDSKATVEERRNYYRDIDKISGWETASMTAHGLGILSEIAATVLNATAGVAHLVPEVSAGVSGFGGSPHLTVKYGGQNVGESAFNWAAFFSGLGGILHSGANLMATQAANERRWDEWKLQERLANKELAQITRQIAAADKRVEIAKAELANHGVQIESANAMETFMRSKYTNQELYLWQIGQISGVFFQNYRLAYDLAKAAERCFRFELGLQDSSFINFGYWDSLKKGLLAGEKLQYDLRRLETAYLQQNRREFEVTKHVSLAALDPLALVRLRETGRCFFRLPEEIFDLDFPGHYFRRIKSVSLTLPCITGPYTTVSCTLRLLKNTVRTNTGGAYARNADEQGMPADDDRFVENNVPIKAIATSSGQNDSGVFELGFRDERFLPFEGAGVISDWVLELFNDLPANNPDQTNPDFGKPLRQFDYDSISDAILHIKYTAREDAGPFRSGVISYLREYYVGAIEAIPNPSSRMFDLRHDFPSEWHRFLHPTDPASGNVFEWDMAPVLFPMMHGSKALTINKVLLLVRVPNGNSFDVAIGPVLAASPSDSAMMALKPAGQYGGLLCAEKEIDATVQTPPDRWQIRFARHGGGASPQEANELDFGVEDAILVVKYKWLTK
jgi:hypothetical protein